MGWLNIVLLLYALMNIILGLVGFFRGHSPWSLVGGVVAGAVIIATVGWSKVNPRAARITALVVTVLLMGRFGQGTFANNELYPSGIIFVASLAVAICLGLGHMLGMKSKRARESTKPAE